MSIAKLHVVKRSLKDQGKCESCGDPLPAGSAYVWWKPYFRSPMKRVRCTKATCQPRMSQRESTKVSSIMAVQEDFDVSGMDDIEDIKAAVQEVAGVINEVIEEYREAAVNPNTGNVFNTDAEEKAEHLESQAQDLESWEPDTSEPEGCLEHRDDQGNLAFQQLDTQSEPDCEDCQQALDDWIEEIRASADEAVNAVELP